MVSGYLRSFLLLIIFLEGCHLKNRQRRRFRQNPTPWHYRALKGETFAMPCDVSSSPRTETLWFKTEEGSAQKQSSSINCMTAFPSETKHSGNYTSLTSGRALYLQVLEEVDMACFEARRENVHVIEAAGGNIPCPRFFCDNNTDVIWYKRNQLVSEMPRDSWVTRGQLNLGQVTANDTGVYFCDRLVTERGQRWTLRRAVSVTAIPSETATDCPRIIKDIKVEVELGQPFNLTCEVYFDFELKPSSKVEWYMNYGGNTENRSLLVAATRRQNMRFQYEVRRTAMIKKVTPQHLNNTYTCVASNSVGNSSITVELKRKIKATWPSLVGYPITSVLLAAALGVILHVKWLEIKLIYKSYFKRRRPHEDEKEFDVFLSYVWSAPSAEVAQSSTLSSRSELSRDELLPIAVDEASKIPLEVLLRHTLEDRWGYRLCLLERDVVPGGAYINDVVLAIKRSRMLICVLSAEYLTNSNAVFVLESGVQALLQMSAFQLLLIWTSGDSTSHHQPDLPLPKLVQTALRVLPSLDWSLGKPAGGTSNFWKSLRKTLPHQSASSLCDVSWRTRSCHM